MFIEKCRMSFDNSNIHFTETHRKTSNFDMCLLNFISTCHFCFIQKIIYHLKRNWPRFRLPKFFRSSIYVIIIVKFSNSPIQNVFNFLIELLWISVKCISVLCELKIQQKSTLKVLNFRGY